MVVYGDSERPRVLVNGINETHPFAAVVSRFAGTVKYLDPGGYPAIRWASWDAVVTVGPMGLWGSDTAHLRVMQIGGIPSGYSSAPHTTPRRALSSYAVYGREVTIPTTLSKDLRELVKRELVPLVVDSPIPREGYSDLERGVEFTPMLTDLDGLALAVIYRPAYGLHECWYLPEVVQDIAPWLEAAVAEWSTDLPDIFPSSPDWASDELWMTEVESASRSRLEALTTAASEAYSTLQQKLRAAEDESAALRARVDAQERVLLTGTGQVLVEQVLAALMRLGFDVEDMDASGSREKREDLRVRDGEWIAICEVKGHDKGATTSDILKANRFTSLFVQESGHLPNATWYVVNQFRNSDPSTRRAVLRGQDDDVRAFGEQDGLVVDTRQLFLLDQAVKRGKVDPKAARESLKSSVGRFLYVKGIGRL